MTESEHRSAGTRLRDALGFVRGVAATVRGRYGKASRLAKQADRVAGEVQSLQIELENAALSEYPNANPPLRYTGDAPGDGAAISEASLMNALATGGEDIDSD